MPPGKFTVAIVDRSTLSAGTAAVSYRWIIGTGQSVRSSNMHTSVGCIWRRRANCVNLYYNLAANQNSAFGVQRARVDRPNNSYASIRKRMPDNPPRERVRNELPRYIYIYNIASRQIGWRRLAVSRSRKSLERSRSYACRITRRDASRHYRRI